MEFGARANKVLREFKKFQVFLENNGLKTVQITLDPLDTRGEDVLKSFREFKANKTKVPSPELAKVG
jgi:hypothetical protein